MQKNKAPRNKTISLLEMEAKRYLSDCISPAEINEPPINKIIQGDLFKAAAKLPNGFVDLLIVDPPYNLSKSFGEQSFKKMPDCDYERFTEKWITAIKHSLKKTASIYVCCDWKSGLIIGNVLQKHFEIQNRITWQREKGRGAKSNWKNGMEDIWFVTVSNDYTFNIDDVKIRRKVIAPYRVDGKPKDWVETAGGNFRDTHPSNFWDDLSIPYWSMPENTDHPTQKPEKLIAKLVLASSNPGDVVLDIFLGSGTSAVVAKKLGRNYVGIERESEYCALAQKRLQMADDNNSIQGFSDKVFWERNSLPSQRRHEKKKESGAKCRNYQTSLFMKAE